MHRTVTRFFSVCALTAAALAQPALGSAGPGFEDEMSGLRKYTPPSERAKGDPDQDFNNGPAGQVIGFYADGRLAFADGLALDGRGWLKIMQPRNRHFGSFDLVKFLEWVSGEMEDAYPNGERLQIGDMSNERGGQAGGHSSHQNGLDADITYFRVNRREQDPSSTAGFDESFVRGSAVTSNFDTARNWALMKKMVGTKRVNRIFVDLAIKHALCTQSKRVNEFNTALGQETLRRIRVWPNHDDHLHLRLTCPAQSRQCVGQEDPPAGAGCDRKELLAVETEH